MLKTKLFFYLSMVFIFIGCSTQPETQQVSARVLELSLNIESQTQFMENYKAIVNSISDASGITGLRVNKNVSENEYFFTDLSYYGDQVRLVFRTKDYYLLGFIGKQNIYYYFSDSAIKNIPGTHGQQSLGYSGSYIHLGMPEVYTHANVASYITTLQNFNGANAVNLKKPLSTIIFITAEAFRFKTVATAFYKIIGTQNSMNSSHHEDDVKNWASLSAQALQNHWDSIKKVYVAKKY